MKRLKNVKGLISYLKYNCTSFIFYLDQCFSYIHNKDAALRINELVSNVTQKVPKENHVVF